VSFGTPELATRSSVLAGVQASITGRLCALTDNGKLRNRLLDRELFLSLPEARAVFDQCWVNYN
jgi:hypothetical protein